MSGLFDQQIFAVKASLLLEKIELNNDSVFESSTHEGFDFNKITSDFSVKNLSGSVVLGENNIGGGYKTHKGISIESDNYNIKCFEHKSKFVISSFEIENNHSKFSSSNDIENSNNELKRAIGILRLNSILFKELGWVEGDYVKVGWGLNIKVDNNFFKNLCNNLSIGSHIKINLFTSKIEEDIILNQLLLEEKNSSAWQKSTISREKMSSLYRYFHPSVEEKIPRWKRSLESFLIYGEHPSEIDCYIDFSKFSDSNTLTNPLELLFRVEFSSITSEPFESD